MSLKNVNSVLLHLSRQGRRVLSPWRAMLALADEVPRHRLKEVAQRTVRQMLRAGLLQEIPGVKAPLYLVTAPYVEHVEVNPYEVLMEASFDGSVAYSSAMVLHRLTDQRYRTLHLLVPKKAGRAPRPLDTSSLDWEKVEDDGMPSPKRLHRIEGYHVEYHTTKPEWFFGLESIRPEGFAVTVTDLERTLIDGLRCSKYCGGLGEVFRAWVRAEGLFDLDRLILYAAKFESSITYQRLGFVLETLGVHDKRVEAWKHVHAQRGGSRLLDPEGAYTQEAGAPYFHPEWKLSINYPVTILETKDASYS